MYNVKVMNTKNMGDVAEQVVALDLLKRGYVISKPIGDNAPYDLIVDRNGKLERIQIKGRTPKSGKLHIELYSMLYNTTSGSNNRTKQVLYNTNDVDWYAIVDNSTLRCYYLKIDDVEGLTFITLRTEPTRNGQVKGIRLAEKYTEI